MFGARQPITVCCRLRLAAFPVIGQLLFLASSASAGEMPQSSVGSRVDVTAVGIVLQVSDASGHLPADLAIADLEVLEDGVSQSVIGLELLGEPPAEPAFEPLVETVAEPLAEPLAEPMAEIAPSERAVAIARAGREWRIVIYLDQALCSRRAIKAASRTLAEQAQALTDLGQVEIVAATTAVETLQPPTRDPEVLRQALVRAGRKNPGREAVSQIRRRYIQGLDDRLAAEVSNRGVIRGNRTPGSAGASSGGPASLQPPERRSLGREHGSSRRMQIRSALQQEVRVIDHQRDLLLEHLAVYPASGPRALLLVSDGFDSDPRDFYLAGVPEEIRSGLSTELMEASFGPMTDRMARLLAASGWTTLSLALGDLQANLSGAASERGRSISHSFNAGERSPSESLPRFLLSAPLEPLAKLADFTGGDLLTDPRGVPSAVSGLNERVLLTYQTPRPPDGKIHRLEVRSRRPGVEIKAPRWVGSATPEEIALSRARQIAQGRQIGDLRLEAMVLFDSARDGDPGATVAARLDLVPLEPVRGELEQATLRVTTAVYFPDRDPFVHHSMHWAQDLSEGDNWGYTTRMSLPQSAGGVVVVVEELGSGSWGGSVAPLVRPKGE
ncbi:MAG: hypothetical protein GY769_05825 [bacterium]|nr:hypothetical protein [bacterium]